MFLCPALVRDAAPDEAEALVDVWGGQPGGVIEPEDADRLAQEARASIARIAADPDQRLLVALVDDKVAGAVHLVRATLSPVHAETALYVVHLHVLDRFRRHGVGRSLMEAAVTWAEEKDIAHVVTATSVSSRDANRFMARLGLGQIAVLRGATTTALRAKLPVEPPAAARVRTSKAHSHVGQVLAHRRLLRRVQARPGD